MTLVGADDRAYLSAVHPARYALGPVEDPALILNAADEAGCLWLAEVPDGWDAPDVVSPMDRRQDGHGGYLGQSSYEPRTLSIEGAVTAPSAAALSAAGGRLRAALLSSLDGFVRYSHLDEIPAPMGLWVRPVGRLKWRALDDRVAEFAFVVVAEDPIKTGTVLLVGPVRLQGLASEGGITTVLRVPLLVGGVPTVTETRRNRIPNPAPASATGYTATYGTGGAGALSYVASGGPGGIGGHARATWSTASTATATGQLRADGRAANALPIPVTPGEVISVACQARASLAQRLALVLTYFDAAGTQTGISPTGGAGTPVVVAANTWTRLAIEGLTVPPLATYCLLGPQAIVGTGVVVWPIGATLDQAMTILERAATLGPYFDAAGTVPYLWVGTAHASASVETATGRTNRMPNPSLETNGTYWASNNGALYTSARITTAGSHGTASFESTRVNSGLNATAASINVGAAAGTVPVTPGETIAASMGAWTPAASRRGLTYLVFRDSGGVQLAGTYGTNYTPLVANAWTRCPTTDVVVPAGAASVYVVHQVQSLDGVAVVPAGEISRADACYVGVTPADYFDGSLPDPNPYERAYAWTGTAAASPSVEQTILPAPIVLAGSAVGQVPNVGDEAAHARYTIAGPVPQPIVQLASGEYFHLRLDLAALDAAVVDTAEGTVTVNGVNRYDAWGPGSTFPLIPPGGTEVRLRSYTGGVDPAAGLTVLTAPSWK